jgi:hypothetical protein
MFQTVMQSYVPIHLGIENICEATTLYLNAESNLHLLFHICDLSGFVY